MQVIRESYTSLELVDLRANNHLVLKKYIYKSIGEFIVVSECPVRPDTYYIE